tara:strand:- start:5264 stop:5608 length:345 start_codon:yes stop_codon:yes gene_type:complete
MESEAFELRWFRRKRTKPVQLVASHDFKPKRTGKQKIDPVKTAGMQRRYDRKLSKLRKGGYKQAYSKPISHMNTTERNKLNKRISSGKYEVRMVTAPPKWRGESPREYAMLRRK